MLIPRSSPVRLLIVMAFFVGSRLPVMYRQEGGEDEEFYAVPGYTVATEGIPRVPYVPARDRDAWFYRVDDALFALPPAYFYWQGPFFLALPAGYGIARLASAAAGLLAVWLVYELGRRLLHDEAVGLAAAALYSLSRVFFFSAIRARPDILCGMLGLAADEAFVFDAYLAGRRVVLACNNPRYFESSALPYDYLIITRLGRQKKIAASMHGRLLREYGNPHDLFACYAQVYVPATQKK